MGKKKAKGMSDKKIEKLATKASDKIEAYVTKTGRTGVGIAYGALLMMVAKLCGAIEPEDVTVATELLAETFRDFLNEFE